MRVLFVTNMWPDAERPWYGTFIRTQAESLAQLGVDLHVLPIRGYAGRGEYIPAARRLARPGATAAFDVVHAHYGHSAAVARLQLGRPLVISYCGDDLLGTPTEDGSMTPRSRLERAVFRQLARAADATITKSAEMATHLPTACRDRNHVIPNGVDMDRFEPLPRSEARRRLGWKGDERVALFVGDPALPRKNYQLAEAACARVAEHHPDLRLQVAQGFAPSDVPVVMSAADVLLMTSLWEGSPNVVKEAMAAELPVVATPVGDVRERLEGVSGTFVADPDPEPMARALLAALDHGRAPAAREAVSALSLENVGRRVLAVYEQVVNR
jgi:teichuronic acid biosynthesis glycosyltransferase TuaC